MTGWPYNEDPDIVPSPSIAESILAAQETESHLRGLEQLQSAARELLTALDSFGCYDLVAASSAAEPLVTAAALLGGGRVSMSGPNGRVADKVILVEAATITGSATRFRANDLRTRGASWVAAVVYHRIRPDLDGFEGDTAFDDFQVLTVS